MKRKKSFLNLIIIITSICAGLITLGLIIVLCIEYSLFNGQLKIQDTGNVGDFFGGVVGSLIGLISVLLLYKTLRYQQKDIESTEISSRLQWSTDLLVKLIDDLKGNNPYDYFNNLIDGLGTDDLYMKFVKDNLVGVKDNTAKMSLEFNVINKLIYQDKFGVSQINLLRLIVFNSLGNEFFNFISELNRFVTDRNNKLSVNDDVDILTSFVDISKNLDRILINASYRNSTEIMNIINNYRVEEDLSGIRLEDWLVMTGKKKANQ